MPHLTRLKAIVSPPKRVKTLLLMALLSGALLSAYAGSYLVARHEGLIVRTQGAHAHFKHRALRRAYRPMWALEWRGRALWRRLKVGR